MKTLDELVKELGLEQASWEKQFGRKGNFVHIFSDNTYATHELNLKNKYEYLKCEVIEVKPE